MFRSLFLSASAVILLLGLTACSGGSTEPTVHVDETTILLDVRSPEEFAAGHLEGAKLLDFNSGEFAAAIPTLDPEAEYLVYCRSGNRSGQAVTLLDQAGFADVTDLGSMEKAAASTGLKIAQ